MNPEELIRHGFVNNFETNSVECLCCRLTITYEALPLCDDLDRLHRERSPQCRIVRNIDPQCQQDASQRNCQISQATRIAGFLSQGRPAGQLRAAECSPCRDEIPRQDTPSQPQRVEPPVLGEDARGDNPLGATGGVSASETAHGLSKLKVDQLLQREIAAETTPPSQHPALASLDARLLTFRHWTTSVDRERIVRDLATAGFFYPNQDPGYVRCFHCNGAINIDRHCKKDVDPLDVHIQRYDCRFAQLVRQLQSGENESTSSEDESTIPQSGADLGLDRIMMNRSPREFLAAEGSTDSSVTDSSGDQTFWRKITVTVVLCNLCKEPIRRCEMMAKCHYCKKMHHLECLQSAMRMRNDYHPPPRAECIDLGAHRTRSRVQITSQNDDSSCLMVGGNSNAELARHISSNRSSDDHCMCNDFRATNNTTTGSVRSGNEPLNASLPGENLRYTCPECKAAMNRICSRCRNKLSDKPGILVVSCNACSRWYHVRCMTRKKNRGVYEDAVWICIFCDVNNASSSSSEDSA